MELLADMFRVGFLFFFPFSYTLVHSPAETCHSLLQVFRVQAGRVQSLVHMSSSSASLEKLSGILPQSLPPPPPHGCHLLISITQLSSMLPKACSLQLCKKLSTEVLYSELQLRPALNHAGLSLHWDCCCYLTIGFFSQLRQNSKQKQNKNDKNNVPPKKQKTKKTKKNPTHTQVSRYHFAAWIHRRWSWNSNWSNVQRVIELGREFSVMKFILLAKTLMPKTFFFFFLKKKKRRRGVLDSSRKLSLTARCSYHLIHCCSHCCRLLVELNFHTASSHTAHQSTLCVERHCEAFRYRFGANQPQRCWTMDEGTNNAISSQLQQALTSSKWVTTCRLTDGTTSTASPSN